MKVGIITFHCSYNFGSALQAYALQRAVTSLGNECLIIDYRSRDYDQYRLFHFGHPVAMVRDLISFRRNARRRSSFQAFWNNFFCLTAETYSFHDEAALSELSAKFDAFVCGSDQIWNLDCTRGVVGPFFLSFAGGGDALRMRPALHIHRLGKRTSTVTKLLVCSVNLTVFLFERRRLFRSSSLSWTRRLRLFLILRCCLMRVSMSQCSAIRLRMTTSLSTY